MSLLFLFLFLLFVGLFYFYFLLFFFSFYLFFKGQQNEFYNYSRVQILCCYCSASELGKTISYNGIKQLRLISFHQSLGLKWFVDFRLRFLLLNFCVFYIILSEFLTKDVLKCIVNSAYSIGCCDCTPFNLVLKITLLLY